MTFAAVACAGALITAEAWAQTQPKPKPVAPPVKSSTTPPNAQTPTQPEQAPPRPAVPSAQPEAAPSEATLGVPFYPSMEFIESYDAGTGQRFYIFGTTAGFADIVAYYRSVLKQRGELVFEEPPTHQFDIGRYNEATMAFPPSITVKDFTWGGMEGYPNPRGGTGTARFRTVIQVVPMAAAAPPVKR